MVNVETLKEALADFERAAKQHSDQYAITYSSDAPTFTDRYCKLVITGLGSDFNLSRPDIDYSMVLSNLKAQTRWLHKLTSDLMGTHHNNRNKG